MASNGQRNVWAILLIAAGLLVLFSNAGWFAGLLSWLWAFVFIAGGVTFLYLYRSNQARWWALIPGFALLAIGLAALSGDAAGGLFLAVLGAGFAAVYASNRRQWWAVIPAGVLLTLALVAWVDAAWPRADAGWLFFLGLAGTFGFLFALPESAGKQRWAIFPALGCLVLMVITFMSSSVGGVVVPLGLIAVGIYLAWRQGSSRGPSSPTGA